MFKQIFQVILIINVISFYNLLFKSNQYIITGVFDKSNLSFKNIEEIISNPYYIVYILNKDSSNYNLSYNKNQMIFFSKSFLYILKIYYKIKVESNLNKIIWIKESKIAQIKFIFLFDKSDKVESILEIHTPLFLKNYIIEKEKEFVNSYLNYITVNY